MDGMSVEEVGAWLLDRGFSEDVVDDFAGMLDLGIPSIY